MAYDIAYEGSDHALLADFLKDIAGKDWVIEVTFLDEVGQEGAEDIGGADLCGNYVVLAVEARDRVILRAWDEEMDAAPDVGHDLTVSAGNIVGVKVY